MKLTSLCCLQIEVGENMLKREFNQLVNEFGVPISLNEEQRTRKVLLSSRGISSNEINYDDRHLHSNFKIQRGDSIRIDGVIYIVYSDVQAKRSFEWKALIRPCTNTIPITIQEEVREIIGRDPVGNPIYGDVIQEEIIEDFPAIVYRESISIDGQQIKIINTEIKVVMGDNEYTQEFKVNNTFNFFGTQYQLYDIDLFQRGLRLFSMRRV